MYEKKIKTENPGLIAFNLDESGSTADHLQGTNIPVFQWTERYFGTILKQLMTLSTDVKGDQAMVKRRYYVLVILYGSQARVWGDGLMDIEAFIKAYTEAGNTLGLGGHMGGTDAKEAFELAYSEIKKALADPKFKDSFPPMMFHLTDGLSHTNALPVAKKIGELSTTDGNALVVNAFIGTQTRLNYKGPKDFPGYQTTKDAGPSKDNIRLFDMSSEVPHSIHRNLISDKIFPNMQEGSRLFFDVRTKDMLKHVVQVVGSIGSRMER